jgi:hypothetical protein
MTVFCSLFPRCPCYHAPMSYLDLFFALYEKREYLPNVNQIYDHASDMISVHFFDPIFVASMMLYMKMLYLNYGNNPACH